MNPPCANPITAAAFRVGMAGLWLGLAGACGKHPQDVSPLGSSEDLSVSGLIAQTPSVSGRVILLGGPPKSLGQTLDLTNTDCADSGPLAHPSWKMDAEGGLAEVVITVSGSQRASNLNESSATIELTKCELKPHVVAVQAGESVAVRPSDQSSVQLSLTRHKLGTLNEGEPIDTTTATGDSATWVRAFNRPGLYRVEGDSHRWMRSWIWVHEGIHKAVSGTDGRYTVERALPDGEYVVNAWHPRFKKSLSKTVQVVNGVAQVDFAFDYSHSFDVVQALDS